MRLSLPRLKMPRLPGFSILVWISTALKGWVMGSREKDTDSLIMYDRTLLWLTFGLAAIGFIMVTSASMPIGQRLTNDPFFFAKRDGVYLILAFILAIITLRLPMEFCQHQNHAHRFQEAAQVITYFVAFTHQIVGDITKQRQFCQLRRLDTQQTEIDPTRCPFNRWA